LHIHNSYLERGGEDEVAQAQADLFRRHGHTVVEYHRSNKEIATLSFAAKARFLFKEAVWSDKSYREIRNLIQAQRPDIAVVHNTFYMISPSAYQACSDEGLPMVQNLHSYRWLLRPDTRGEFPEFHPTGPKDVVLSRWLVPRILRAMAAKKVFEEQVRRFVCLCEFCKGVYVRHGFKADKISVVPASVDIAAQATATARRGALFVGRLADYKGVRVLLKAMEQLDGHPLRIVGDGPLRGEVEAAARSNQNIVYLGRLAHQEMLKEMDKAAFFVFPSLCYETFGKVLIEAFSRSLPVIASRGTTAEEIAEDAKTGLLFERNDHFDLAAKMKLFFDDPSLAARMGEAARRSCEARYGEAQNYKRLLAVYESVLGQRKDRIPA
jgi:glycosyltransferase involved in cell wall biosynthesis